MSSALEVLVASPFRHEPELGQGPPPQVVRICVKALQDRYLEMQDTPGRQEPMNLREHSNWIFDVLESTRVEDAIEALIGQRKILWISLVTSMSAPVSQSIVTVTGVIRRPPEPASAIRELRWRRASVARTGSSHWIVVEGPSAWNPVARLLQPIPPTSSSREVDPDCPSRR